MTRIDHFFVFSSTSAPEQQRLLDRGVAVGVRRDHPGQGTANACFGFADSYLELLWLADEAEALGAAVAPLALDHRARWRSNGASPFGICVRPTAGAAEPPFAHWHYRPAYLPADVHIAMADNSGEWAEPMLFHIDRPHRPFEVTHDLSSATLVSMAITTPQLDPSSLLHEVDIDGLELRQGGEHLMEVQLACGDEHGEIDLRPELPLVLRW